MFAAVRRPGLQPLARTRAKSVRTSSARSSAVSSYSHGCLPGQVLGIGGPAELNAHAVGFVIAIHELDGRRGPADADRQQPVGKRIKGAGMADPADPGQAPQAVKQPRKK